AGPCGRGHATRSPSARRPGTPPWSSLGGPRHRATTVWPPSFTGRVIGFVEFNGGHRYADFIPGTDKVAAYGIAALIAGGLAAKAGLFKVLLGALVALKKVIVMGFVAAAAFLRKLFGRKPTDAPAKP